MAVPKKRRSKMKQRLRRTHYKIEAAPNVSACPNCNEPVLSHQVCPSCGHYKAREIFAEAE